MVEIEYDECYIDKKEGTQGQYVKIMNPYTLGMQIGFGAFLALVGLGLIISIVFTILGISLLK